jgi:secreted Zn-dependent insulinase-like peptidase
VGPDHLKTNALLQLLVQLGKRDAFYTLRTQEQLGYIVSMFPSNEYGVQGVAFILQSDKFSAAHLASRVEVFVGQLLEK